MSERTRAVVRIGGAAGEGIASTGDIFAKTASRMGLWVYAYNSYQSVIRGGHVYYQMQIGGGEKILSHGDEPDVLVALNQDTVKRHANKVKENGAIIFNSDKIKLDPAQFSLRPNVQVIGIPVKELTQEFGSSPIMQNTVDTGALVHLLGLDWGVFEGSIKTIFGSKKAEIAELNIKLAIRGRDYAKAHGKQLSIALKGDGKKRGIATGNSMFAFGALAGGCKFYSAYPMTPASSIMHWLAPRGAKYGLVMKQMEDELAAINAAIGAGQTGVRSMTGTSGGGFALMTEGISLAAMLETPVVAIHVARGGPSTGLPTKTEQGDLFQDIGAGQGDYPKCIITPLTVEDCYQASIDALNLAEKYQTPVIILSDLYLSEHAETVEDGLVSSKVKIERGDIVSQWKPSDPSKTEKESWFVPKNADDYLRYKDTPSGVSPRIYPGTENAMYVSASDEHDEEGIVISDVFTDEKTRIMMMNKRMRKQDGIKKDTAGPLLTGPKNADFTLVGYGSTHQILEEVRIHFEKKGKSINHVQFRTMWPLHATETEALLKDANTIGVENNYTSQMAKVIRMETGIQMKHFINKFDGEPFTLEYLEERVQAIMNGKKPANQKELAAAR